MLIPPQAALVLATALAAAPPVQIPTQGGREPFALEPRAGFQLQGEWR